MIRPRRASDPRVALGLLLTVYCFNFIDRTIISVLQEPLKQELGLSDTQLGLVSGTAFALFYSVLGVPIARLAERVDRPRIIAAALAIWSLMTMVCGLATSFIQLFLYRVGVGIGEAGGTPPAHALLSDLFPPERRATAISIYSLGVPLGILFGAVAGGALGEALGWRATFMLVGAPGLILALVVLLVIRDPRTAGATRTAPPAPPSPGRTLTHLAARRAFVHLTIGITVASTAGYGILAFTAPFFMRQFEMGLAAAGYTTGLISGLAAGVGTLLGGLAVDRAMRRDTRFGAWIPATGLALAAPLSIVAYLQEEQTVAIALLLASGIAQFLYLGPTYALVQSLAKPTMRATASALVLLTVNLVGLGMGPPLTGWLSDHFAAAADNADNAAYGLRIALVLTASLFVWGALHYRLAARYLAADLERAG
ncbi:MAG TPA: MFS transporter [Sphingopyxis sp.]|nr:MFS transporter [Sphingopyxis sp.]